MWHSSYGGLSIWKTCTELGIYESLYGGAYMEVVIWNSSYGGLCKWRFLMELAI